MELDVELLQDTCGQDLSGRHVAVVYYCDARDIDVFGGFMVSKNTLAYFIIITDVVSMAIILIFVNLLIYMQKDFATQFDEGTVEMRDFTVATDGLPASFC